MGIDKILNKKTSAIAVIIPIILILFPPAYSLFAHVFAQGSQISQPFLERPDPKYEKCVKETEYMRYHHWELLRAVREEIVRYGNRGEIGLSKCKECHTSRERFCDKCHNSVSMSPDCYGCHYYP